MEQLTLLPRDSKETHREYVYRLLRHNIIQMNLYPNQPINENSLSELLHISKTPIHEAVLLLAKEQLITIVPQSGSRISPISIQQINDGLFLRNTIEPKIYQNIAGCVSPEYLQQFQDVLQRMKDLLPENPDDPFDVQTLIELDDEFHGLAYKVANRYSIWQLVYIACAHYHRIRYQGFITQTDDPIRIYEEHKVILEYLMIGPQPDDHFVEFYTKHLTHYKEGFAKQYSEHPEFFSLD